MRIDVMVDLETLGTGPDSTIFQIAAIAFDIRTGKHLASFNKIADISKNVSYEMNVSGDTLKWWLNTDKELLARLLNDGEGSSSELIVEFHTWLTGVSTIGEIHLWGNGILFDNNLIRTQMESQGLKYPVKYNKDRDVRTIVDLLCAKLGMSEKELREKHYDSTLSAHDALNDVINQIKALVVSYNELTSYIPEGLLKGNIGKPGVEIT